MELPVVAVTVSNPRDGSKNTDSTGGTFMHIVTQFSVIHQFTRLGFILLSCKNRNIYTSFSFVQTDAWPNKRKPSIYGPAKTE